MNKIEQIIKDLEANACMDKPGGVLEIPLRQVKITLEKHFQEPTEERGEEIKIYILRNNYYGYIDIFNKKDATHYIQYQKKGDDRLSVKHGNLQELVGDYEYGDEIMNIELIEKTIVI